MRFKEWLKLVETGTTTADEAVFARPVINAPRRQFMPLIGQEPEKRKKASRGSSKQHLP